MAGAGKYCLIHCAEDHNTSECRALDKVRSRFKGELGGDTLGPLSQNSVGRAPGTMDLVRMYLALPSTRRQRP